MSGSKKKLAQIYQQKTDIEHILDAPDTYIGSVEADTHTNWILDENESFTFSDYEFIGGLYKCFDEGIVNCRDHFVRLKQKLIKGEPGIIPVRNIEITVDKESGVITMYNDGNGVDVAKHPENKLWIPEMIFGHLRTSTNYDKNEKKIVGGKNGFGFKLVLIYAKWGEIETVDHIRKKKYTQRFENNLTKICKPSVSKSTEKPYTKVSWLPDYKRFGIENITDDIFNLFKKRTYDIGVVTDKSVKVKFNNNYVPNKSFEQYIDLYIGPKTDSKRVFHSNKRWEVGVCISPLDEFTQVSYVNGINTLKGGKHVEYILNQIVRKMQTYILKRKKINVKPASIKEQLMLFISCVIENPSFDSQTKEYMNTPQPRFGSKFEINEKFIDKLAKMGVMESAINLTEIKDNKAAKKTDGRKTRSIRGIPKYMGANWAGGSKSEQCTLILCEGDSAKAGIVSGLSKYDRDKYGVFPLKGKLLNTLDAPQSKINNNNEIINIKKILGLVTNKSYTKAEAKTLLRYGKVLFMTDQDLDGSHIKGLCINMFHSQWHDLVKISKFFGFMNTPILKAKKGKKEKSFYNEAEYTQWKQENNNGKGWNVKYYKGLGTSTSKEFKEYFAQKKVVWFKYNGDVSDDAINKVFNKTRADDRKTWLANYDRKAVLNPSNNSIGYEEFIDREMIHFSKYDCERSIPCAIDGKKTSTRKILYSAFKKNLTKEIKVAQFAGYVSEHSCYHHGEMSLNKAIVGEAQEYVGSNNINSLLPKGQFGTRLEGGKDSASERYIYTELNPITREIYKKEDEPILNYLDDDGTLVEPDHYVPIIPMILVNGGKGIGTGFSYEGLSYNPEQIITYIKHKITSKDKNLHVIEPYYEGFKGSIIKLTETKFLIKGTYEIISHDTVRITELPIGSWTSPYKAFLETLMDDKKKKAIIKNYKDSCTDTVIDFTVKLNTGVLPDLISKKIDENVNQFEKTFRLTTTKSTTNMYLFNSKQQLRKYNTIYEIVDDYYPVRYDAYVRRKEFIINSLQKQLVLLSNRGRFIKENCDDEIDLRKKKKEVIVNILKFRGYDVIDGDEEYKYLRKMPMDSVCEENYQQLLEEKGDKETELNKVKSTSIEKMWIKELDTLYKEYCKYKNDRKVRTIGLTSKKKKGKKKTK